MFITIIKLKEKTSEVPPEEDRKNLYKHANDKNTNYSTFR